MTLHLYVKSSGIIPEWSSQIVNTFGSKASICRKSNQIEPWNLRSIRPIKKVEKSSILEYNLEDLFKDFLRFLSTILYSINLLELKCMVCIVSPTGIVQSKDSII